MSIPTGEKIETKLIHQTKILHECTECRKLINTGSAAYVETVKVHIKKCVSVYSHVKCYNESGRRTAYAICLNDSVEYVVVDSRKLARKKLKELDKAYYELHEGRWSSHKEYKSVCRWHISSHKCSII